MSWQRSVETLEDKLAYIFTSGEISDVTVIVGKENYYEHFRLHRFVLSIYSEVFEALFYGSMANTKEIIELPEDDPNAFGIVIRYMYTGKMELCSIEEAISVFYLSDKYLVFPIKNLCVDYLRENVGSNSLINIYQVALMMGEGALKINCLSYFEKHIEEVLAGNSFFKASLPVLLSLFENAQLKQIQQTVFYKAVTLWGKNECQKENEDSSDFNVRLKIEPLLHCIDFTSMSAEEFVNGPGTQEILTEGEQLNILKNIIKPGATALPEICAKII